MISTTTEENLLTLMKMELHNQGIEWEECDFEKFYKLLTNIILLKTAQEFGGLKVDNNHFISLLETNTQKNMAKFLFKHLDNNNNIMSTNTTST